MKNKIQKPIISTNLEENEIILTSSHDNVICKNCGEVVWMFKDTALCPKCKDVLFKI
jgi:Zn finger protein HypA/HybF involved in hydrogenase expression